MTTNREVSQSITRLRREIQESHGSVQQAQSLRSRRRAPNGPSFQYFTAHCVVPHRGLRTDRYKLIQYCGEGHYWELVDLEKDPSELTNSYGEAPYRRGTGVLKHELTVISRRKTQDRRRRDYDHSTQVRSESGCPQH